MTDNENPVKCPNCQFSGKTTTDVAKHVLSTYDSFHMLKKDWAIAYLKRVGYTDAQIKSYSLAVNPPGRFKPSSK